MDKLFVRWDKAHGKWDNPPHGGMNKYGHYNMASSWELTLSILPRCTTTRNW